MSAFGAFFDRIEARACAGLALSEIAVPAPFARAEGTHAGRPIAIETRAYVGPTAAYARFCRITDALRGEIEIGNALVIPNDQETLPILAFDLVALGGARMVVAVDLAPVAARAEDRARALVELGRTIGDRSALPLVDPKLGGPLAIHARVSPEERPGALAVVDRYVDAFLAVAASGPRGAVASPEVARWLARHRADRRLTAALARWFGSAWATTFVATILFPDLCRDRATFDAVPTSPLRQE